jgi:hypothetical protein
MSEDIIEYVVAHAGQSRRQFLVRLLATSAFAAPVIASFAIGGTSTPKRSPLDAGSNIDCGPNSTFDEGSNSCVDDGSNETDGGSNETDGGSNETDGGSNETEEDGGIPSTL